LVIKKLAENQRADLDSKIHFVIDSSPGHWSFNIIAGGNIFHFNTGGASKFDGHGFEEFGDNFYDIVDRFQRDDSCASLTCSMLYDFVKMLGSGNKEASLEAWQSDAKSKREAGDLSWQTAATEGFAKYLLDHFSDQSHIPKFIVRDGNFVRSESKDRADDDLIGSFSKQVLKKHRFVLIQL
jgi:hypothetical protein